MKSKSVYQRIKIVFTFLFCGIIAFTMATQMTVQAEEIVEDAVIEEYQAEDELITESDEVKEEYTAEYPAQDFEETSSNGVTVRVSASEGAFPEGTSMKLSDVSKSNALSLAYSASSEETKVNDAVAVDITFYNSKEEEIEPAKAIQVSMSLSESLSSGDNYAVAHDEGNGSALNISQTASSSEASFSSSSFSVYVIYSEDTVNGKHVATYNFYGADNETVISTQNVKDGDTLYAPSTPEKDDYTFIGWAETKDATQATFTFDGTTKAAQVSDTKTIDLYPVYEQTVYVYFMNADHTAVAITKTATSEGIDLDNIVIATKDGEDVTGWYTDDSFSEEVTSPYKPTNSVTLYPKVESGYHLTFSTGSDATIISDQFVAVNSTTEKPSTDPVRQGYTFNGWVTEEGGSTEFTFGQKLTEDTTVYASWTANTVKFTVVNWLQSSTDLADDDPSNNNYDVYSAKTYEAKVGDTVHAWDNGGYYDSDLDSNSGYSYYAIGDAEKVVEADGTTVLNIFYVRNKMTITFKWNKNKVSYTGLYKQKFTDAGLDWNTLEPIVQNPGYMWRYTYSGTSSRLYYMEVFSVNGNYQSELVLNRADKDDTTTVKTYKQSVAVDSNGDYVYSYDEPAYEYDADGTTFNFSKELEGYTVDSYYKGDDKTASSWTSVTASDSTSLTYKYMGIFTHHYDYLYVRYSVNKYNFTYNNNGTLTTVEVPYGVSLTDINLADYEPTRPDGMSEDYTFQGWYSNAYLTRLFDFDTTMPARDVVVYAKWVVEDPTVTVHYDDGSDADKQTSFTVEYGSKLTESDLDDKYKSSVELPEGSTWIGWATKNANGEYIKLNYNSQITKDTDIYPYFVVSGNSAEITYHSNQETDSTYTDTNDYTVGISAAVKTYSSTGLDSNGRNFAYWTTEADGSGDIYSAGQFITVLEDINLYAQYSDTARDASIKFYNNDGTDSYTLKTCGNNLVVEQPSFTREGYIFNGWNTKADGSGQSFSSSDNIRIDNVEVNELYAQWLKTYTLTVTANSYNEQYDGEEHTVSGFVGETEKGIPVELDDEIYYITGLTSTATGKDVVDSIASIDITGTEVIKDVNGNDVTDKFKDRLTINRVNGSLTISPVNITLTANDASKVVGTADPILTVSMTGTMVGDDTLNYTVERVQGESVGSYAINITLNNIVANTNTTYTVGNYSVKLIPGTFTITATPNEGDDGTNTTETNTVADGDTAVSNISKAVQTSDINMTNIWIGTLFVSIISAVLIIIGIKKKSK